MRAEKTNDKLLLGLKHQVVQRLFPQSMIAKSGHPSAPRDWTPLRGQQLKIDDCLDGLPAHMRSPKVANAHIDARSFIVLAVERAHLDLERRLGAEHEWGAYLQNSEDMARRLAGEIGDFPAGRIADLHARDWPVAPGFGYRAARIDRAQHNDIAKVTHAALDALKNALDTLNSALPNAREAALKLAQLAGAQRNRLIPPHASGDVWRQGFVAGLCFGWFHLTECDPTPDGGRFRRFVEKCYESLAGNDYTASQTGSDDSLPEFDEWIGVIRTVVNDFKGRPAWNGFRRYDLLLDPPGTTFEVSDESLAERQLRASATRAADLAAIASVPGVRELFERLAKNPLGTKPRKPRSK